MATIQVGPRSRLLFGFAITIDGVELFDTLVLPTLQPQSDDTTYEWKSNDQIDLVANRFYGDPVLWWVLALANDIEIVPIQLDEGKLLKVPSPRYVTQILLPRARTLARAQR